MPTAVIYAVGYLAEYEVISVATAYAIGSFVATYGTALMVVGGLAYSMDQQSKARQSAKDQFNAGQVDRLSNVSSAVAPRELVLGRVRKAGTVFYKASSGSYNKDMYLAIALAAHEIDAVEQIYLNDVPVTLDGSGNVTSAPYYTTSLVSATASNTTAGSSVTLNANFVPSSVVAVTTRIGGRNEGGTTLVYPTSISGNVYTYAQANVSVSYQYSVGSSAVQIITHLGAAGQSVDPLLAAAFPGSWPSTNTVQGVAYLVARFTYSESAFPSGAPTITAVVRGAKVYDPRTGVTAWTENPALLMRHVYQHPKFGKAPVSATEDARFVSAANSCDIATTYTVGGVAQASRALFTAALVLPFGTAARSAMDDLEQAMGGSWAFYQGELYIKPGVYSASSMSFGDADLANIVRNGATESQTPIKVSAHKERAKKFNTVNATLWDSAQNYKQATLTPLQPSTYLARDGDELVQNVTFNAISYAPQAMHVSGIMLRDARDPLSVEIALKMRAYPVELFDTIALTIARYGWVNKTFIVLARTWAGDGVLNFTLKETTAAITQMDASFPAQGFAANTNLPAPWTVADVGTLTITSGTTELLVQGDGTVTSRIKVAWVQVPDAAVVQSGQVEVQYRRADSSGAWTSIPAAGADTSLYISDVQDGVTYVLRARATTSLAIGAWGQQVGHTVVGKSAPPPAFDIFTVMAQPDGTRQYNFGYSSIDAQPADWLGAEIRYVAGTVPTPDWATMTPLQDATTYYTNSPVELNAPLSGAWTFACKSLDTTGNESAYLVRNITLPDRRLGNVFDEFFEGPDGWLGVKTGCQIVSGILEAIDSTTWATAPATWAAWSRWNTSPTSPITYESPVRDFGTVIAGQLNPTVDADGTVLVEMATSMDGTTWTGWGSAISPFSTRYLKVRLTVTATGPVPIPVVRAFNYQINAPIKSEYINDLVISSLTGSHRIGVGDIRIPLAGTYAVLKRTTVVIQDGSAGQWSSARQDQTLTVGPRWQFRLNGVLADPAFVDFFIEGY